MVESHDVVERRRLAESIDGMSFSFVMPSGLQSTATYFLDVMHYLGFLRLVLFTSCKKDKERD